MSSYINAALRRLVATRAEYLCEYCLIHEEDAFFGCEVDHIISDWFKKPNGSNQEKGENCTSTLRVTAIVKVDSTLTWLNYKKSFCSDS